MENLGDERTDPMVGLGPSPRKRTKGKKHNPNKEILEDPSQFSCNGWQSVPNLWMHYVASQHVNWCHIEIFWPMHKHDLHML
jgi:hypothetical protein